MHRAEQRFIVLVNKNNYTTTSLSVCLFDNLHETTGITQAFLADSIVFFPTTKLQFESVSQSFYFRVVFGIQAKMQYSVFVPFCFKLFNGKSFKKFFLSTEIRFQRRKQQTFAKTTRAAKEIWIAR